ncbi:MAG: DUF4476 domain-containing protein [Chitinophagaceae bacterium]|nr:DUF4476 domain-containing protein [Chitinophagaceae bacterium]
MKLLPIIFVLFISFLFSQFQSNAQKTHFIYLQTENKQPFYVKLQGKIFNSSPDGYVIISKLRDGDYKLAIGFPKNEWPEEVLNCKIDNRDNGYMLKNFGEKGWGLFDMQTYKVVMPGDLLVSNDKPAAPKDDAFSTMLANVVNDSTIKRKEVVKENKEVVKEEKQIVNPPVNEPPAKVTEPQNAVVAMPPAADAISFSVVKRKLKKRNKEGLDMMYVDETGDQKDTIRIFIPAEVVVANNDNAQPPPIQNTEQKKEEVKSDTQTKEMPPASFPEQKKEAEKVSTEKVNNSSLKNADVAAPLMINSDCKSEATDDDFLKLRKKMAAENGDEDMVKVAKKVFKTKCFTTEQVKNLTALFLKDDGKYMFLDASYPYVSDSHNFPALQSQLSDEYYITRFKAMMRK